MTQAITSLNQKSLLRIIQEVMGDLGLPQPNTVIGNTDSTVRQLLVHATRVGEDLAARAMHNEGWQVLRKEYLFNLIGYGGLAGDVTTGSAVIANMASTADITVGMIASGNPFPYGAAVVATDSTSVTLDRPAQTTAAAALFSFGLESYPIPDDCDHFMTQTGWDRSFRWQLVGPLSPQEWQVLKSGISPTGPRLRYRIMDSKFYVNPVPASLDSLVVEYYSTGWCQSAAGVPQTGWLLDSDTPALQDRLFTLGILARFLNRKGFDSSDAADEFERAVQTAMGRTGGARDLPLNARAQTPFLLGSANVPDTGYGS